MTKKNLWRMKTKKKMNLIIQKIKTIKMNLKNRIWNSKTWIATPSSPKKIIKTTNMILNSFLNPLNFTINVFKKGAKSIGVSFWDYH